MGQSKIESDTSSLYDDLWNDLRPEDFINYRSRLKRILPEDMYSGKICLDAGCGQGAITSIISTKAKKLYSVDIGKKALQVARKNAGKGVVFRKASLLDLPFPDNRFDVVVSNGVVHHTPDPEKALGELKRVLKPGGKILLGLYGKTGILRHAIEATSLLLKPVPYRFVKRALSVLGFSPLMRYYLLDYIYVPIRKRFSIKEARSMLAGFSDIQVISDYPQGKIHRIIYGTNYFYITAKKKTIQ